MQAFCYQHCHFPGAGSRAPAVPLPLGHVQLASCCFIAQCQGVGWWPSKLCLPARRSMGMCRCWYNCNNTCTVVLLVMYSAELILSFCLKCRTEGFAHFLMVALDASHWRTGWRGFRQKGSCTGREGNWRLENTYRQGSPKLLFMHKNSEIHGSCDSPVIHEWFLQLCSISCRQQMVWSESNWKVGWEGTVLCLRKFSAAVKDWIIAMPLNSYIVLIKLFKCEFSQKLLGLQLQACWALRTDREVECFGYVKPK